MKNYSKLYIFIVLSLPFFKLFAQDSLRVSGKVINGNVTTIQFIDAAKKQPAINTDLDEEGKFFITTEIAYSGYYYLTIGKQSLIIVGHPGDNININVDVDDFISNIEVDGSEDTKLVYIALIDFNNYIRLLDSLQKKISVSKANGDNEKINKLNLEYQELVIEKDNFVRELIKTNNKSLAALLFIDNFKIEKEPELFKMLSESLIEEFPDNIYIKDFKNRVDAGSFLAVGTEAPEITLPNPEGEMISLSSLRGQVVLIDFWASWCGPCRRENPNMVRIYKEYKDKGFEIYGVSLDNSKDKWVATIKSDHMSWIHVSDLKYWKSEAARLYNVGSIPYTVLIDKEGKIIAKGLRGEALDTRLNEIFGHN